MIIKDSRSVVKSNFMKIQNFLTLLIYDHDKFCPVFQCSFQGKPLLAGHSCQLIFFHQ